MHFLNAMHVSRVYSYSMCVTYAGVGLEVCGCACRISAITHCTAFIVVFEASNSREAHCAGGEMHACEVYVCVCVCLLCMCVSALYCIYFDLTKSMFEAVIEIQASNRLSCCTAAMKGGDVKERKGKGHTHEKNNSKTMESKRKEKNGADDKRKE